MDYGILSRAKALMTICFCASLLSPTVNAQITEQDGLRAPGGWNGWTNNLNMGGDFDLTKITDGLDRWTTTFEYTGSTGSVEFKFVSGGSGNV